MEFGLCFALCDFQKVLFFILMEFLMRYLPRLSTWVCLVTLIPQRTIMDEIAKNVVQHFFWIKSLEITNILEFGFSPFSFLFDLLSKRNNIFFFWNRSCVSQNIGTSVKCTGLLQNNIFFWKGNCAEFFWSHWPTMQLQDGNLSCFLTDHCSPQSTEALSACSPLITLWITASLSLCSSIANPLSQLPENLFANPPWPLRAMYIHQPLALKCSHKDCAVDQPWDPSGDPSSSHPPLPTSGRSAAATLNSRACVAHGHRQTLRGQEKLPPPQLHPLAAAPAVFSSPPGVLRAEGEDKEKGVQPKSLPVAAAPSPRRHLMAPTPTWASILHC